LVPKLRDYLGRIRKPVFPSAICGHRGASKVAPENTCAAFRGAVEVGCDLVELDVIVTRDEELVVIHDAKLGRTTDRRGKKVTALTLEEIQACDAGCWFDDAFKGERVPTLREALDSIRHKAVPMIEVKQRASRVPALVPKLAATIAQAGYSDHVILIAWDDATAKAIRAAIPEALIARIAFTRLGIRRAANLGFDGVVPWRASATGRFLREARDAGIFVAPWTVNRPKDMQFFARAETDIVITDVPHVLREELEKLGAPTVADASAASAS
jgi:glycerophosphoryl diester phosphodiesterase